MRQIQSFNDHQEKLNIPDVRNSINNYDIELLKKSVNPSIVNKQIFKIFDDDKKPLWTPLIKISTLKTKVTLLDAKYFLVNFAKFLKVRGYMVKILSNDEVEHILNLYKIPNKKYKEPT